MTAQRSAVRPEDLSSWRECIGRSEVRKDVIDAGQLKRFATAVGSVVDVEREAPPLAHWAFFVDTLPADRLGEDGHAERGTGVYPSITLPRRLFASSSIELREPLTPGGEAELTLTLTDVRHRAGRSGDTVLIDVERRLRQAGRERIVERQTIAYRPSMQPMVPIKCATREVSDAEQPWTPRPTELFRFSAVTFNAHRIHYDERYATQAEGYPGLVVQGPLTAIKLFAFAQARLKKPIRHFSFRAVAPLFVDQPVTFAVGAEPNRVACIRWDGKVAMTAAASGAE